MPMKFNQPSFTGGEASPSVAARTDLARYQISLKTMRNFWARYYGGAQNRPGTRFVVETKDSTKQSRLIRFEFNTEQAYALEVGHQYIRIVREGAQVESSPAVPVEVVTPYLEADLPALRHTQSADVMTFTHPKYMPRELRRLSETSWELKVYSPKEGPFIEENDDQTKKIHASATTGPVTLTANFSAFNANMVGSFIRLDARRYEDEIWEPVAAVSIGNLRRYERNVYRCTAASGSNSGTVAPTHQRGREKDGADTNWKEWLYLHSGYGIVRITGYSSATSVTGYVTRRLPSEVVGGATTAFGPWTMTGDGVDVTLAVAGATAYDDEDYEVTFGGVMQPTDSFTVDRIADVLTFVTAPANGVLVSARQLATDRRTDLWSMGAWSEDRGYPSIATYFGDRLVTAATPKSPQTVWGSKVGRYNDYGLSSPLQADDAFRITVNSRRVNRIRDMVPLKQLILLTSGGEWILGGDGNGILGPETVNVLPESNYGAADVRAELVGNTAIYVQDQGGAVRDLAYSFESDGFSGADLMTWSDHLLEGHEAVEVAYHQNPYGILWLVRDDGILLSMTYLREQEVLGWARHDTGGDQVESICVVPEGKEDYLYLTVKRTINGNTKRYIERLDTRIITDVREAYFVDCGLSFDGTGPATTSMLFSPTEIVLTIPAGTVMQVTALASTFVVGDVGSIIELVVNGNSHRVLITAYTSATQVIGEALNFVDNGDSGQLTDDWAWHRQTMTGLAHLNGREVAVLNDGNVEARKTVSGGAITLDRPGRRVHVGIPIESDFETLEVNAPNETIRDRKKVISQVSLVVDESRGIFAGEGADSLWEYKQRDTEDYMSPTFRKTGVATIAVTGSWAEKGRVFIRQSDPLPLTILAAIPEYEIGG